MTQIIKLTRGLETLVSDEDAYFLSQWSWYAHPSNGGVYSRRSNGDFMQDIIARRILLFGKIDHKDRNPLNNQRCNLRIATRSQNKANTGSRVDNSSGYKGVYWYTLTQCWCAQIGVRKRRIHLGYFNKIEEAAIAYNKAALFYYGEFAVLNIIKQIPEIRIDPDSYADRPFEE